MNLNGEHDKVINAIVSKKTGKKLLDCNNKEIEESLKDVVAPVYCIKRAKAIRDTLRTLTF